MKRRLIFSLVLCVLLDLPLSSQVQQNAHDAKPEISYDVVRQLTQKITEAKLDRDSNLSATLLRQLDQLVGLKANQRGVFLRKPLSPK